MSGYTRLEIQDAWRCRRVGSQEKNRESRRTMKQREQHQRNSPQCATFSKSIILLLAKTQNKARLLPIRRKCSENDTPALKKTSTQCKALYFCKNMHHDAAVEKCKQNVCIYEFIEQKSDIKAHKPTLSHKDGRSRVIRKSGQFE